MIKAKMKKSIRYRALIKSNNSFFKVGTVAIGTYTGDMLYTPSNRVNIQDDNKEIDHISWHINGRVHIKYFGDEDRYNIIQKDEERQKISEVGFQELLMDRIKDYRKLPEHKKKMFPLDVVFDVDNYTGSVVFNFSMVSGKLIIAQHQGEDVPIKDYHIRKDLDGFSVIQRALGWHSGNADVMLQYSLRRTDAKKLKTNRNILIPFDMKIPKAKENVKDKKKDNQ